MSIFDKTTNALKKSMDFMMQRNNVISSNIANAETPGYKAQKIDFENQLAGALQQGPTRTMAATEKGHFPLNHVPLEQIKPDIYDNPDINVNNDKNTVDVEQEMSKLTENQIRYRAASQLINKKLGALKYAVSGGGR